MNKTARFLSVAAVAAFAAFGAHSDEADGSQFALKLSLIHISMCISNSLVFECERDC